MSAMEVVALAVCLLPFALGVVLRVRLKREFGSFFADYRRRVRVVRVPVSHRDADGLCHRALRAVVGDSESDRRGEGRFEGGGLAFRLVEDAGTTTITLTGGGDHPTWLQAMYVRNVRAGYERVDAVADWIEAAPLDGPLAENHPSYRAFGVI
jgi:hypothetical protein